ncbi:MAG TPA: signal peptidase I [Pseudomonadota bacterium]|nr:signal peptidase I [Pseudomonadota bacterium]HNN50221.1 signal peptidase I [Pseudomonadota bacterium]
MEWPYPDKRPALWLRMLFTFLWLPTLLGFVAAFLLGVYLTNSFDLSFLSSPRLVQGVAAVALVVLVGVIPYVLFRGTVDWVRHDLLLHREAHAALVDVARWQRESAAATPYERSAVESARLQLAQALRDRLPRRVYACLNELDFALSGPLPVGQRRLIPSYLRSITMAILLALGLQSCLLEPLMVPSGSMIPTLQFGEHLLVSKIHYGVRIPWTQIRLFGRQLSPQRGDVLVYEKTTQPGQLDVGRVVGLPGDRVAICQGNVSIFGQVLVRRELPGMCEYEDVGEHPHTPIRKTCRAYLESSGQRQYLTVFSATETASGAHCEETTVRRSEVLVVGDNRDHTGSAQVVLDAQIVGQAWMIFWSAGERTSVRLDRLFHRIR